MRLAIITELFSPSIGGQEVRYLEMGKALVSGGHQLDVYTIRTSPDLPRHEIIDGISVYRVVDGFNYQSSFWGSRNFADIVKFTVHVLMSQRSLQQYDILLFNKWPILPQIIYRFFVDDSRVVVDWCEIRSGVLWHCLYRGFATNKFRHIAVSSRIADILVTRHRIARKRTRIVLSGVSTSLYESRIEDKQDKMILFFGRLSGHKNPLLLLESFCSAGLAREGFTLHVAGAGPLLEEIKLQFGMVTGVHIYGSISEERKIELLKRATLLVLPSRREGFPRVIAEAAAAGTPSLTTRYPDNGAAQVVEEYSIGWVCEPDSRLLAQAMRERGTMTDAWLTASRQCRDAARRDFDWMSVCKEFVSFTSEQTI